MFMACLSACAHTQCYCLRFNFQAHRLSQILLPETPLMLSFDFVIITGENAVSYKITILRMDFVVDYYCFGVTLEAKCYLIMFAHNI